MSGTLDWTHSSEVRDRIEDAADPDVVGLLDPICAVLRLDRERWLEHRHLRALIARPVIMRLVSERTAGGMGVGQASDSVAWDLGLPEGTLRSWYSRHRMHPASDGDLTGRDSSSSDGPHDPNARS